MEEGVQFQVQTCPFPLVQRMGVCGMGAESLTPDGLQGISVRVFSLLLVLVDARAEEVGRV